MVEHLFVLRRAQVGPNAHLRSGVASRFLRQTILKAFRGCKLPPVIDYTVERLPACDAMLYSVEARFKLEDGEAGAKVIVHDGGGLRCIDDPEPEPYAYEETAWQVLGRNEWWWRDGRWAVQHAANAAR